MIVAIDGPAASGKSTTARKLAQRLGAGYLDTGSMYRAIAAEALRLDIPLDDAEALTRLASEVRIEFEREPGSVLPSRVLIDGRDVTREIRTPEVDAAVSPVSAEPGVRKAMVRIQRDLGSSGDWVVEGRDIGTVVFPDAPVKVYLTATTDERARRRSIDLARIGAALGDAEVHKRLCERDAYDSSRKASPLEPAADAVVIDTSDLSVDSVVDLIAAMTEGKR